MWTPSSYWPICLLFGFTMQVAACFFLPRQLQPTRHDPSINEPCLLTHVFLRAVSSLQLLHPISRPAEVDMAVQPPAPVCSHALRMSLLLVTNPRPCLASDLPQLQQASPALIDLHQVPITATSSHQRLHWFVPLSAHVSSLPNGLHQLFTCATCSPLSFHTQASAQGTHAASPRLLITAPSWQF